jgi:TolA-binding protein
LLDFARRLTSPRDGDRYKEQLQRIIKQYPKTKAAAEAKKLLENL